MVTDLFLNLRLKTLRSVYNMSMFTLENFSVSLWACMTSSGPKILPDLSGK